jgi:uncharacterized protein YndB with AHSA1/START domain
MRRRDFLPTLPPLMDTTPSHLSADGVFSTGRLLPFTPEQVYAAFADGQRLARWWGPAGFRNSFETFEFRPQGRWKFVMHGPDGTDYPNENIFLETSAQRIVIRHVPAPQFTLAVTLTAQDGHTRLEWRQSLDDPEVARRIATIVLPANEQNLDRLTAELQGPPDRADAARAMQKLRFSTRIQAPRQRVWELMLAPDSYRIWTAPFSEGSYYEGSWEEGGRLRFLTPGGREGMVAEVAQHRPAEYVSLRHIGQIRDGMEDVDSPEVRAWAPAYENYGLIDAAGGTEVQVEMDVSPAYESFMQDTWPRALAELKALCERS